MFLVSICRKQAEMINWDGKLYHKASYAIPLNEAVQGEKNQPIYCFFPVKVYKEWKEEINEGRLNIYSFLTIKRFYRGENNKLLKGDWNRAPREDIGKQMSLEKI